MRSKGKMIGAAAQKPSVRPTAPKAAGAVKLYVVDDEEVILTTLREVAARSENIEFTGGSTEAATAIREIRNLKPDVIILDIRMPGMSGVELTGKIKDVFPQAKILMFTGCADALNLFEALRAGACGYLVKPSSPTEIREAVAEAHQGGFPVSKIALELMVTSLHRSRQAAPKTSLTKRESEVMSFILIGKQDKEIAKELGMGRSTVHTHISRIFKKLGVTSRVEAIRRYLGYS